MVENNTVINSVAVIGAGTMGRGIAYLLALNGIRTLLYNRNGNHFRQAQDYIVGDLDKKIDNGKISQQKKGEILANLVFSPVFDAIADSDLVIETIAEHEPTKHEILAAIAATVKKEAIIATNTSSLSLNKLAAGIENNSRFIGLHFFNPAPLMKLIEIIPSYFTARTTTLRCEQLVTAIGKKFVVCKATPGFIVNRMARPFYLEGFRLLDKITIIQGGFGKSYGAAGGYIAAPRVVVEAVRSWAPAFVFSTSSPAPVAASFKYNLEHDNQRKHLLAIIDHLKSGLRTAGIPLVSEDSHILPVLVGDPHRNKHISKQLLDDYDIYVQPVNAPTVPAGSERLRVTPTSAHTHDDVEYFLAVLSKVWVANALRRAG